MKRNQALPSYLVHLPPGQNTIVVVNGANSLVAAAEVETALSNMESPKVMLCQLEIQPETTLKALRAARADGGGY